MLPTTVNTDESRVLGRTGTRLTLRWLFPDPSRPIVPVLDSFQMGRDPSCLVQIEGEGVSRIHASVKKQGKTFVVADAGSTNGTYLNGDRITQTPIAPGSLLRVGSWIGLFERLPSTSKARSWSEIGPGLCGGAELREAVEPARRAAKSNLPVILGGETGTGKEVAAKAIHRWSERSGNFCAVNCAALPENLVEGELFGYRRGAFTGADRTNPGHFRQAHRGTLLLDEINELPLAVQAKLLRVLQEGQVVPLGESSPIQVDVRILAAAQSPIAKEVEEGRFREDLFMRLQGLEIELPPLRERVGDIPELFMWFLQQESQDGAPDVEGKLIESLCLYHWPGNVRELQLAVRRLLAVHGQERLLRRRDLPASLRTPTSPPSALPVEDDLTRLARTLQQTEGNLSKACERMNISRQRAYRLLAGEPVKQFLARVQSETPDSP